MVLLVDRHNFLTTNVIQHLCDPSFVIILSLPWHIYVSRDCTLCNVIGEVDHAERVQVWIKLLQMFQGHLSAQGWWCWSLLTGLNVPGISKWFLKFSMFLIMFAFGSQVTDQVTNDGHTICDIFHCSSCSMLFAWNRWGGGKIVQGWVFAFAARCSWYRGRGRWANDTSGDRWWREEGGACVWVVAGEVVAAFEGDVNYLVPLRLLPFPSLLPSPSPPSLAWWSRPIWGSSTGLLRSMESMYPFYPCGHEITHEVIVRESGFFECACIRVCLIAWSVHRYGVIREANIL